MRKRTLKEIVLGDHNNMFNRPDLQDDDAEKRVLMCGIGRSSTIWSEFVSIMRHMVDMPEVWQGQFPPSFADDIIAEVDQRNRMIAMNTDITSVRGRLNAIEPNRSMLVPISQDSDIARIRSALSPAEIYGYTPAPIIILDDWNGFEHEELSFQDDVVLDVSDSINLDWEKELQRVSRQKDIERAPVFPCYDLFGPGLPTDYSPPILGHRKKVEKKKPKRYKPVNRTPSTLKKRAKNKIAKADRKKNRGK